MSDAKTSWTVSPGLVKVAERAKRHPDQRILALAHHIDEPALERAFRSLRRDAAVGVDGVTVAGTPRSCATAGCSWPRSTSARTCFRTLPP